VDYLGRRVVHPGERLEHQHRHLQHLAVRLARCAAQHLEQRHFRMHRLTQRIAGASADLRALQAHQDRLAQRLVNAADRIVERRGADIARLASHLSALNPKLVLERGFAIVASADGSIVREASQLQRGDAVRLTLAHGAADARITDTRD
jgi:exodeoxyribonuclease VII large subunit